MKQRRIITLCILILLVVTGIIVYRRIQPRLLAIDPVTPMPGDLVNIVGHNLGKNGGELLLDNVPLPSQAVILWSPVLISFRMPSNYDSATVQARTKLGVSNPLMIALASKVPAKAENNIVQQQPPSITSIKPSTNAQIGKLIELRGSYFGMPEDESAVFFSKVPIISAVEAVDSDNFIRVESMSLFIDKWNSSYISAYVPDGVENGYVLVRTRNGLSNAFPISVSRNPGRLSRGDSVTYTLEDTLVIHVAASLPDGRVSFILSKPPTTQYQSTITTIETGSDHLRAETAVWQEFRFGAADARLGRIELRRRLVIDVCEIKADIAIGSLQPLGAKPPAFLSSYLAADALVSSANPAIVSAALSIQKKEKNPFRQIVLAAQWTFSNIKLNEEKQILRDDAINALKSKAGGMRSLVLINCALLRALGIPAIPVAGFLVTEDMRLIPHYWSEYYLAGIGWIPFDPALAIGITPSGFRPIFTDRSSYYQGIDNRHIAMARGYQLLPSVPVEAQSKTKISWSLFEYDEAAYGLSYTSTWNPPVLLSTAIQ